MTPRECPNCGRLHTGADFHAEPGPTQRERDVLASRVAELERKVELLCRCDAKDGYTCAGHRPLAAGVKRG